MIEINEMRKYLKLRGRTKWIAKQSGYPYTDLLRFMNGKTSDPRSSNIRKLADFIERDRIEFEKVRNL